MRVLVTGSHGYIGSVLVPILQAQGHTVVGLDADFYAGCDFLGSPTEIERIDEDVRDVQAATLRGFEAVLHLAALSNDPLGNLDPALTDQINHAASVRLARLAKEAGVPRFVFTSSCSIYGAAGDRLADEQSPFNPVTAYGRTKALADRQIALLADDHFSPIFLRPATAYGVSPRLRLDVVLNELVALACTTGRIVLKSDGTPWRPVTHVEDIAGAFAAVITAPLEAVHGQAFNVGRTDENYRIRDLAQIVQETVPGSTVEIASGAGPDTRCYRVDFDKLPRRVPGFRPRWTVRQGARQLYGAYREAGLTAADLEGPRYYRLRTLRQRLEAGQMNPDLRRASSSLYLPFDAELPSMEKTTA
mgnify:FL=1